MKKLHIFTILISIFILLSIIFICITQNGKSTLGNYSGLSKDQKWSTSFKVYNDNNETLLKGELICLDNALLSKFSDEEIKKSIVTLVKDNGISFGGDFLNLSTNHYTIINYVKDDGSSYKKMLIHIGNYKEEIKLSKSK